jgi:hypothetical protein
MCLDTWDEDDLKGKFKLVTDDNTFEALHCGDGVDVGGRPVYYNEDSFAALRYSDTLNMLAGWSAQDVAR